MVEKESYFQTRLSYEPERDAIWKVITEYLERYVPSQSVILELGAGYCSFINQVTANEKHALDKSDIVKKYAADDVQTHIGDCVNLRPFKTNQFDVVFSSFLYEHLTRKNLNRVMDQLHRILKPGGVLITLLPNFKYIARHYFDDYTHVQIFSHLSFSDYLTSRGFNVTDVQGRFLPYSFKSRLPKSPALTRIYLALPFRPMAGNMLVVAVNTQDDVKNKNKNQNDKKRGHTNGGVRKKSDSVRTEKDGFRKDKGGSRKEETMKEETKFAQEDKLSQEKKLSGKKKVSGKRVSDSNKLQDREKATEDKVPGEKSVDEKDGILDEEFRNKLSTSLESQLPDEGVRFGRKSRRDASEHYGVNSEELEVTGSVDMDNVSTFKVKKPDDHEGTIKPSEVRTRKRRK